MDNRTIVRSCGWISTRTFLLIGCAAIVVCVGFWESQSLYCITRQTAVAGQVAILGSALERYKVEHGRYPTIEEGLAALRPYLDREVPRDPWGRAYVYKGLERPTLLSYGADGLPGGSDMDADTDWRWMND